MAGINLSPHVGVILGQGALFSLGYLVVRNLLVVPYLRLRARRHELTTGQNYDLHQVYAQIEQRRRLMEENTRKVLQDVKEMRERSKAEALGQARELVRIAQGKADTQLQQYARTLREQSEAQKQELEGMVGDLSDMCLQKLLPPKI